MPRLSLGLSLLLTAALGLTAQAENWPCWRGPRGDGTVTDAKLPTAWSDDQNGKQENIVWKVPLPGVGHSSPVVWDNVIFLTTCLVDQGDGKTPTDRLLMCLDKTTGKEKWRQSVCKSPLEKKHTLNSFASGTPTTDGQSVFVTFLESDSPDEKKNHGQMVVAAYDFAGKRLWEVRPGEFSSTHGYCSSPVLFEDLVIVNGDHDGNSYIVALRQVDGSTVWKTPREHKTRSYCTPIIRRFGPSPDAPPQLILSGSKSVCAYNPRTGERIWNIDGPTEQFVASMVDDGKLLFMTCGFPERHILAIKPDGKGNVTETHIAWRSKDNCAYVPSPIICDGYFLVVADNGIASCFRAADGERLWLKRIGPGHSASLLTAGGLVYFLSDRGTMKIIRPGKEYEEVAVNELGEDCFASPAASDGKLYVRSVGHLYCIGK
ncbi:MAG: PQQ-binding-like beta-propeller repeat protein [Planctomycetales bacterium]|nr:PQQ-binding-like beta-propeller repeat protein [Planctomycetales bacterium]MBN8629155.1 PQQ-binding-like beta-propeller repeat protein [Planctomycetota bacterium]